MFKSALPPLCFLNIHVKIHCSKPLVQTRHHCYEQSIAQEMNLYFSSVFTHEQSDLPEFDNMIYDNLSHILCTSSEVEKHLKALNIHKSPGPDLISPHILKECALELSTSLCVLFNKSFSTGMLPADWKIANITPIHKKGNKHKKENYRQISLTSIVCKIAEKIVRSRITTFWSTHHVLNPNQFGYLKESWRSHNF